MNRDEIQSYQIKSLDKLDKLMKQGQINEESPKVSLIEFSNPLSLIPAFNLTEFMLSNYKEQA